MKVYYLHGMGGSPADWRWVQEHLPGEALAIPNADSPDVCATELAKKITEEPFVLCGYSMGGRLAILTAEKLVAAGKMPRALVLASTGFGSADPAERGKRLLRDREWAELAEHNLPEFWKHWYEQELFSSYRALPSALQREWSKERESLSPAHQLRHLSPANHGDLWPVLQQLCAKGLRTIFVVGENDKKYLQLSRQVPGTEAQVLKGAGHLLPLEAPEALAVIIRAAF